MSRGLLAGLLVVGCAPVDTPSSPASTDCADPVAGLDRFVEAADARGLVPDTRPQADEALEALWSPGRVVVEDLDGDGDPDALFSHAFGPPQAFANVGGTFEPVSLGLGSAPEPDAPQPWMTFSVVDWTEDGRPDLVLQGAERIWVSENLGDLAFGELQPIPGSDGPAARVYSHAWGDVDGDGDLDLWLPTMNAAGATGPAPLAERLYRNDGGALTLVDAFDRDGALGLSILAAWTDRDGDGDLDLLSLSDKAAALGVGSTAYRNDGGQLLEDGPEVGLAPAMSAMGFAGADLDGDGGLDYCVSDVGPLRCFVGEGPGWVESGLAMGLQTPKRDGAPWSAWSLELVDLDHDGWPDLPVTGGPEGVALMDLGSADEVNQPDELYAGRPGGFEPVGAAIGFDDPAAHLGMAAADVDGDGSQDLVVAAYDAPAALWMNRCSDGGWLTVRAVGAPGNPLGLGARVTVTGERTRVREIQGQRALGQGPARAHFGLGDEDVVDVEVRWTDGAVMTLEGVEARQTLRVEHPDA